MANSFSDLTVPTAWKEGALESRCEHHDQGNTCDHSMDFHLQDLSLDFLPASLTSSYLSASPFQLETHPLCQDCLVLPQHGTVNEFNLEFQGEISVNDFNLQAALMDNVDISVDDFHLEPAIDAILHRESDKMKNHINVAIAAQVPHQNVSLLDTQASSMGPQLRPISLDEQLESCGTEIGNKTRMRWTQELHDLFVQAVEDLGGPERATPKSILIIMGVEGLTMCQVKSHLQKYRLARFQAQAQEAQKPPCSEGKKKTQTEKCSGPTELMLMKETDTLHMQLELQKKLHYQLTVLRELQIQTEENGRRLQEFIENQREAFMMVTKSISSSRVAADVNSDTEEAFPSHKRARLDHPKSMKFRGNDCMHGIFSLNNI